MLNTLHCIRKGNPIGSTLCEKAKEKMDAMDSTTLKNDRPQHAISTDIPATEAEVKTAGIEKRKDDETLLNYIKRSCVWCARSQGGDRTLFEFLVRSQGIWLHALQYKLVGPDGEKMCYRTNLPEWSKVFLSP